jgi:shikimate kinase
LGLRKAIGAAAAAFFRKGLCGVAIVSGQPQVSLSMKPNGNIILIGMPGSGKSTVGAVLAERLGYDFLDTDVYIQQAEGKTLQQIIGALGVEGFRRTEEAHLLSISCAAHVIAPGGSAVYSPKAMEHLKRRGIAVYLELALEALEQRLGDLDARGVARAPGQTVHSLLAERHPLYRHYADLSLDCNGLNAEETAERIAAMVNWCQPCAGRVAR